MADEANQANGPPSPTESGMCSEDKDHKLISEETDKALESRVSVEDVIDLEKGEPNVIQDPQNDSSNGASEDDSVARENRGHRESKSSSSEKENEKANKSPPPTKRCWGFIVAVLLLGCGLAAYVLTRPRDCFRSNSDLAAAVDDWFDSGFRASVEAQYGAIGDWCFRPEVTSMSELFYNRQTFNEDISRWDVWSVTNMNGMFFAASSFNQDLSQWNVSSVTDMRHMFLAASSFNQDLSVWDVSSVTDMHYIFDRASSFNQNLCAWGLRLQNTTGVGGAFLDANSCPTQADPVLSGNWSRPGPFCHVC